MVDPARVDTLETQMRQQMDRMQQLLFRADSTVTEALSLTMSGLALMARRGHNGKRERISAYAITIWQERC